MKKIIIKYLIMYMAFVLGIVLFSFGITNLFSSMLLFVGGYASIKNTFDYRIIKRNISKFKKDDSGKLNGCIVNVNIEDKNFVDDIINKKESISSIKPISHNVDNIMGIKRIRRYGRVRRRY